MSFLTSDEFAQMERLLADLLSTCDDSEVVNLLSLHARLQAIYAAQSGLQASRDRLMALQSRTAQ